MKQNAHSNCNNNPWSVFHVCMLGIALTGLVLVGSASDMGAFAPLLIAQGFAFIFFSLACEAFCGIRWLLIKMFDYRKQKIVDIESSATSDQGTPSDRQST